VPGGRLTSAAAAHESPYGRIESSWQVDRGLLRLDVTAPPGTTAEVVLPGRPARHAGPGRHSFRTLVES
jgi:alpha-L-rhamnosidase